MPLSGDQVFLIDTDVLAHIRFREDSRAIYDALGRRVKSGTLRTVHQVFGELKKHPVAHAAMAPFEKEMTLSSALQYCAEVQEKMDLVGQHAGYLWPLTGGKNPDPADPWLIAVAAAHNYAVVTDESSTKLNKIPGACRHPQIGATCISGPHFLIASGIVTEVKPEHIDPHAFFGIGAS